MAGLIWTDPALSDLDAIADYIALDKPDVARKYVQRVFDAVEQLQKFPASGSKIPEVADLPYRQLIVPPCRILYRINAGDIVILSVMRSERQFVKETLLRRG